MMPELEPDRTMRAADRQVADTTTMHERTTLQPVDHKAFFAALDTPSTPTDRLGTALARHRETTASQ